MCIVESMKEWVYDNVIVVFEAENDENPSPPKKRISLLFLQTCFSAIKYLV